MSSPRITPRLRALDGLRGLAILLVMLHHFAPDRLGGSGAGVTDGSSSWESLGAAVAALLSAGWCGVDLFFVLSGFLITGILLRLRETPGGLGAFYGRRFLRIAPLYYAVLLVVFEVLPFAGQRAAAAAATLGREQIWFWSYASNFRLAWSGEWLPTRPVALNHFWSLAVEEHYYLAWPLVVLRCSNRTLLRVAIGCMTIALGLRAALILTFGAKAVLAAYVVTPCRMDALALGSLLAIAAPGFSRGNIGLVEERWLRAARWTLPIAGLGVGAFVIAAPRFASMTTAAPVLRHTATSLFFGALLLLALGTAATSPFRRLVESRALAWLGTYSYGLYVFHPMLRSSVRALASLIAQVLRPWPWGAAVGGVSAMAAGISASMALAFASYHLFEKRFLALKKSPLPVGAAPSRLTAAGGRTTVDDPWP